ncbi:MAG: hypothetical protein ACOX0K_10635 [Oscillospiraceae bacterium]
MEELFGNWIQPACRYCENAYPTEQEELRLCSKKGIVKEDFSCRAFRYDPLMRVPHRPLDLVRLEAEDFSL